MTVVSIVSVRSHEDGAGAADFRRMSSKSTFDRATFLASTQYLQELEHRPQGQDREVVGPGHDHDRGQHQDAEGKVVAGQDPGLRHPSLTTYSGPLRGGRRPPLGRPPQSR
jgi:hypothetical protein